jgi:hypothetical protein
MPPGRLLKYLEIFSLIFLLYLSIPSANAQREYAVCDSTEHFLNSDTSIIAGRNHIYTKTQSGINLIYNFSQTDTNYYIRDFDIIHPDLWYTLIGSRYISSPTTLYKSNDHGINWLIDTSFYSVTRPIDSTSFYNSINQVNEIGNDTILLFVGYYFSGIVFSIDGGITWNNWFQNLIAHYHGIFECDSLYYIFGLTGDAISPWMFSFPKTILFRSDSLVNFNHFSGTGNHPPCYNGLHPDCIYGNSNWSRCDQYNYFKNYTDSICSLSTGTLEIEKLDFSVYPNPADQTISVTLPAIENEKWSMEIYNSKGEKYFSRKQETSGDQIFVFQIESFPAGLYFFTIQSDENCITKKVMIR